MDEVKNACIPLNRDRFMRQLLGQLAETIEDVAGLEHAEGLIAMVGQNMGDSINRAYKDALDVGRLDLEQVAAVLVDLKRRIEGDFYLLELSDQKIILGNRRCPFGGHANGRPALCMMTSNVFGVITAENNGYARVEIKEAIANGDAQCRVEVSLDPSEEGPGREYFVADP
ncbi:transcriptional regulator [Alcanivorax profundi]|uniref:Transcriptional regulator n=1 Tax=Alcanivorax profundi TaxID=2338368 RepID=A0A418XZ37_9GAMM|nr:methanogen output domain 1-containing protein [Alcanivorax profundi]RJG18289.1 transcriptional regulator [Alcanivorax profundi]